MMHFDAWGFIPSFIDEDNPKSVREQFADNYISGWNPFGKGKFVFDAEKKTLKYPGDPVMHMVDEMQFRDETIMLFPSSWVLVLQRDGSWEVARMD